MLRSCLILLTVGMWMATVLPPALAPAGAAEPATALVCAKADLALMYRLADEPDATAATPIRLAQAGMRVLEARAACRTGNYANGIEFYAEADALTDASSASTLTERR